MKTKNISLPFKIYGLLGKAFCACAGGIVGFILGGPLLALPAIFLAFLLGHFFEKALLTPFTQK